MKIANEEYRIALARARVLILLTRSLFILTVTKLGRLHAQVGEALQSMLSDVEVVGTKPTANDNDNKLKPSASTN